MTKLHLLNLPQTVVNTFLIINISNSNNLNKFDMYNLMYFSTGAIKKGKGKFVVHAKSK